MQRESCLFYMSWLDAIENLPRDAQGDSALAILRYALRGEDDTERLKPIALAMLSMARALIDKNNKRLANGKKGGRPKTKTEPMVLKNETETKPMVSKKEEAPKEKVTPKELPIEEKEKEKDIDKSISQKKFIKPTVDQVAAYCKERGNNVSATSFVNFYESKGWMVGKNHMKDWKAAVRTWEQSPRRNGNTNAKSSFVPLPDNYEIDPNREVSFIPISQ